MLLTSISVTLLKHVFEKSISCGIIVDTVVNNLHGIIASLIYKAW